MTRAQEISELQARYRRMMDSGHTVTARTILLRLRTLMTRQIRAETVSERKFTNIEAAKP